MSKKLTQQEAIEKCKTIGLILTGQYDGYNSITTFLCPKCNKEFQKIPAVAFRTKSNTCQKCSTKRRSIKRSLTQAEATNKAKITTQYGYCGKLIGKYISNHIKTEFECQRCFNIFLRTPNHLWNDKATLCTTCSKYFDGQRMQLKEDKIKNRIANIKINEYSGKYVSGYSGNNKLAIFECPMCSKQFKRRPGDVTHWKLIFCRKCGMKLRASKSRVSQEELDKRCSELGIKCLDPPGKTVDRKLRWICIECGSIFKRRAHDVFENQSKCTLMCLSCSKQNRERIDLKIVEQRDNQCNIKALSPFKGTNKKRKYQCVTCQKPFWREPTSVWSLNQVKCKHCACLESIENRKITQQEAEQRAINLGIRLIGKYNGLNKITQFQCKCGKFFNRRPSGVFGLQKQTYCTKCMLIGPSRIVEEKLFPLIAKILNFTITDKNKESGIVLEKRIPNWSGPIDIIINNIAIEYDGYYYHRTNNFCNEQIKIDREKRKTNIILNANYKLLRIRSDGSDIPTENQLRKALNNLQKGARKQTITMKSWKNAERKYTKQ